MDALQLHNGQPTMTSREIAELTGKRHDNVRADIEKMAGDLSLTLQEKPEASDGGRPAKVFVLSKRETLILVSGYSVQMRARIIDRWQELEAGAAHQIPQTYAQALMLAAQQAEQIEQQALQIEAAKPAVEFVGRYVKADGLKGFREVCKLLKANEARFTEFLIGQRIMYRLAGRLTAHQQHIDAGRFEVRTGEANDHAFTTTKFTPKGVEWVAGEWAKHCLPKQA